MTLKIKFRLNVKFFFLRITKTLKSNLKGKGKTRRLGKSVYWEVREGKGEEDS